MNTEWLYKCQEGAGELSLGKDTKFYSSQKKNRNIPADSKRNCEHFGEENFVTLPVFIQPGGFSTSPHVGYNSTGELNV